MTPRPDDYAAANRQPQKGDGDRCVCGCLRRDHHRGRHCQEVFCDCVDFRLKTLEEDHHASRVKKWGRGRTTDEPGVYPCCGYLDGSHHPDCPNADANRPPYIDPVPANPMSRSPYDEPDADRWRAFNVEQPTAGPVLIFVPKRGTFHVGRLRNLGGPLWDVQGGGLEPADTFWRYIWFPHPTPEMT